MNKNNPLIRLLSLVLAVALLQAGCGLIPIKQGEALRTETHSVEADTAKRVKVQVEMELGELNIRSGNARLMDGTFHYNVAEWKPEVVYELRGDQGTLYVTQPGNKPGLVNNGENIWDLLLGNSVPMQLEVKVGAGDSKIDLTQIDLTNLSVDTGLGNLDLDLRGHWNHDIDIAIKGGVGDVTLRLPADTGARVEINNGIGVVSEKGMDKDGNAYVNGSYGQAPNTLYIQVENGTGKVNLEG